MGGVSAALATAGLVGVTSTSASAAPVSTTYVCSNPLGSFPVPVSVDIALLPSTAPAGFPVPAGLLSFKSTMTIPGAVQQALDNPAIGPVTAGKSDDFSATFGSTSVKAPVKWDTKTPGATVNDPVVYSGDPPAAGGANAAFTLPAAGTYAVNMPKAFTLQALKADGTTAATALCTSANPTQIGTITLTKQIGTVTAKAPKSVKVGKVVTVKGKVTNEFVATGGPAATGKLVIKDGKKTVGKGKVGKNGKYKIKVKNLKVGKHKLTVTYKGDDYTAKAKSKKLKVTVTK